MEFWKRPSRDNEVYVDPKIYDSDRIKHAQDILKLKRP